ncbi:hypothetical protein [Cerasicoccus maritimus]|uniref:hypothetical protein n=1 Tax=Cerasicoccus maritimus TaxID=490089 RepID=UPI002852C0B5|nr:hypothetical protein [Cerasicoccus maritimus]
MINTPKSGKAAMRRTWDERELREYRAQFLIGVIGLGLMILIVFGLAVGVIPQHGLVTMIAVALLLISFPVTTICLLNALRKGPRHRPSVMEMFAHHH